MTGGWFNTGRRVESGTKEFPAAKDVILTLISRLIEEADANAWCHFEVVAESGWLRNLMFGKQPFVEVAYLKDQALELNPGIPSRVISSMPSLPEKWLRGKRQTWTVPTSDQAELVAWIEKCLVATSGRASPKISGWIEGL